MYATYIGFLAVSLAIPFTYLSNENNYKIINKFQAHDIKDYISYLNKHAKLCMKLTNNNTNRCLNEVKDFIKKEGIHEKGGEGRWVGGYYGYRVLINKKEIIDNRRYGEEREENKVFGDLLPINASIEITKNIKPDPWASVLTSITFLSPETRLGSGRELYKGFTIVRSKSFLMFLFLTAILFILSLLAGYLMQKSIIAKIEFINKFESEEAKNNIGPTY